MRFPCFDCKEREPGCHGKCEHYRKAAEDRDKERAERERLEGVMAGYYRPKITKALHIKHVERRK